MEQFERIRRDHRLEGLSIRELARRHKVHRRVVRQALASAVPPPRRAAERPAPVFGPYEATVRRWLTEDHEAPKKQRHTARRVFQRLVVEHGADLAESTVREHVRRLRREIGGPAGEVTVPQVHRPGHEAEVDFGEFYATVGGELTKLWLFGLRLSYSGRAMHRAFVTQAQEAFLAGHVDAFGRLGGVPGRIRYDNLKPAVARVLLGRDRVESERFVAFRSHYGFDSFYCRPGKEGAHEKGGVEGDMGWFRRNHLVPVPHVADLEELNDHLAACDEADLARVVTGQRQSVAVRFATEALVLSALPAEAFSTSRHLSARVDQKGRICVRQCRYSVPASLAGRTVAVELGAEVVVVRVGAREVARHRRLVRRGDESLVLDHYLEVLVRKPGALASSVPLAQARAAGAFGHLHDAFWQEARFQLGDRAGTKALIGVLLLARQLPNAALSAGIEAALAMKSVAPEVVAVEARRAAGEDLAPVIPIGSLERFDRPVPTLEDYDELIGEGSGPMRPEVPRPHRPRAPGSDPVAPTTGRIGPEMRPEALG